MNLSLEGKTAIVTCAAGGIGRAVVRRFLAAGAKVMVADRDGESGVDVTEAEGACARIAYGTQDRLDIANLIAATVDRFDRIDALVNAAPLLVPRAPVLELETIELDASLAEHVGATFALCQAVARRMVAQGAGEDGAAGAIVNISSISGQRTVPGRLVLSVCAAALDQLTRALAAGLAGQGIRVNGVTLGGMLTADLRSAIEEDAELRDRMVEVAPLGRLGQTDEAAGMVLFLASPMAGYVTGQVVAVDGGRSILDALAATR